MKRKKGFTLIELLIVVAIIGILAAIAVPNFMNAQIRAKLARVESDMRTLATAFSMYRLDQGRSPRDNFPNHGWFYSYALLTSPVAYMPSVIPDVFQAEDVNLGAGHRIGGPNGKLTYDYGTDEFHGWNGHDTNHAWFKAWGNSQWKIGSPGPDKAYQNVAFLYPGAGWLAGAYYNSSNGLISPGDIFRCEAWFQKDRD
jgi:prepilin-type N-terminal cleavage/methylation domain-containing protein